MKSSIGKCIFESYFKKLIDVFKPIIAFTLSKIRKSDLIDADSNISIVILPETSDLSIAIITWSPFV